MPVIIDRETGYKEIKVKYTGTDPGQHETWLYLYTNVGIISGEIIINWRASNTVSVSSQVCQNRQDAEVAVNMNNQSDIVAVQMDFTLPEGASLDNSEVTLGKRAEGMSHSMNKISTGEYRLVLYSMNNKAIACGDDTLFTVRVHGNGDEWQEISINDVILCDKENQNLCTGGDFSCMYMTPDFALYYYFNVDGINTEYKTAYYKGGEIVIPEPDPVKEGYTFLGWGYIPDRMPCNNQTVYGSLTKNYYNVSFVSDGDTIREEKLAYGSEITMPEKPSKTGYTFTGWSPTVDATVPAYDATYMALWIINSHKLTYIVDGSEYKNTACNYGESITLESEPAKTGYTFYYWDGVPADSIMPDQDVVITAVYALTGDVNYDQKVNVTDAVDIVNDRLGYESSGFILKLSDVNADEQYTVTDAVGVLNIMYGEPVGYKEVRRQVQAQNETLTLRQCGDYSFAIDMNSVNGYSAFQFDVELPGNAEIGDIVLNGDRCKDFAVRYRKLNENRYRVAAYNLANEPVTTGSGNLLNFNVVGSAYNGDVNVTGIHFATKKAVDVLFEDLSLSTATGIQTVNSLDKDAEYNLSGLRVNRNYKGVVIVNGKKTIKK